MAKNKNKRKVLVLNGIETYNKGAELMLYAILQEIERKYPDAIVYLPYGAYQKDLSYIKTNLDLRNIPHYKIRRFLIKSRIGGILRRLHLPYQFITENNNVKDVDYFLDGSGFAISDQWKPSNLTINRWKALVNKYGYKKSKMVFLPQAFGPALQDNTKKLMSIISDGADIIMPREDISEEWLIKSGVNNRKIYKFTDFTNLVEGEFPQKYQNLKNGISIIPNARMIDKGIISKENYLKILSLIIEIGRTTNHPVYLLNHEGKGDEELALECVKSFPDIEFVNELNALEVKGLISSAYICISSRFHGVASALNSCVPCLATSWSHKYEELYKDYGLSGMVLNLKDLDSIKSKVLEIVDPKINQEIRDKLMQAKPYIQTQTRLMWKEIW